MEFYVNWLGVGVATLAAFIFGSLWYGPIMGKRWMKENNFTEEDLKKGKPMWKIILTTLILTFIAAIGLSLFLGKEASVAMGAFAGFAIGFFWIGTSKYNNVNYEGQSTALFLIHYVFDIVTYTIMGILITVI